MNKGILVVFSGPSGAGKSTVLSELIKRRKDVCLSVSATTRGPRPGEVDGESYHYVSREEFKAMAENGELLEWAEYVNNYYGTPLRPIEENIKRGKCVILEIEVKGAGQIREMKPEAIHVFVAPKSFEDLKKRIRGRNTESEEVLETRMNTAREEYKRIKDYDYIVINDDLERAVSELDAIITAALCRTKNRADEIMAGVE